MNLDTASAPARASAAPDRLRLAMLLVFGFAVVFVPTWLVMKSLVHSVDTIAGIFKPTVSGPTVISGGITDMRKSLKLIVDEADVTAEITKSESYYWWKVYFGTTVAHVRATGCHLQYIIPLEAFNASDVQAVISSDGKRTLRVTLPEPVLNEDIVEVNYNNIEVEASSGWARFNKSDVAEEAKKMLRQAAIDEAKQPWHLKAVRADAEVMVRQLLKPIVDSLQPDVKFEVEFVPKHL